MGISARAAESSSLHLLSLIATALCSSFSCFLDVSPYHTSHFMIFAGVSVQMARRLVETSSPSRLSRLDRSHLSAPLAVSFRLPSLSLVREDLLRAGPVFSCSMATSACTFSSRVRDATSIYLSSLPCQLDLSLGSRESVPSSHNHPSIHPSLLHAFQVPSLSARPSVCRPIRCAHRSVTPARIPNDPSSPLSPPSPSSFLASPPPRFSVLCTVCRPSYPRCIHHHHLSSSKPRKRMASPAPLPALLDLITQLSTPPSLPHSLNLLHLLIASFLLSPEPTTEHASASYEHILAYYHPGTTLTHFTEDGNGPLAGGGRRGWATLLSRPPSPSPSPGGEGRTFWKPFPRLLRRPARVSLT